VEGTTTVPISWLLEGSLTVVMDCNKFTNYETTANQEIGETNLVIIHPDGHKNSVITGTNIVPEFPYSISILLATLGAVIVLARMLLIQQGKLARLTSLNDYFQIKVFNKHKSIAARP
jgi:hypothetical protein